MEAYKIGLQQIFSRVSDEFLEQGRGGAEEYLLQEEDGYMCGAYNITRGGHATYITFRAPVEPKTDCPLKIKGVWVEERSSIPAWRIADPEALQDNIDRFYSFIDGVDSFSIAKCNEVDPFFEPRRPQETAFVFK